MTVAVLTGDIVASSSMSSGTLERVRSIVLGSAGAIDAWETGTVAGSPEFFRGDSWQLLLGRPRFLLRASILIRARLLATGIADTRIAIGVGAVSKIDGERISLSSGEAFMLSGRALDGMKDERMVLTMSRDFGAAADFAAAVVRMCDAMMSGWTARQAEIAGIALEAGVDTHPAIVSRLVKPVTVQTVGRTLQRVRFDAIEAALSAFESARELQVGS